MPDLEYYYFPYSYWARIVSLVLAEKAVVETSVVAIAAIAVEYDLFIFSP